MITGEKMVFNFFCTSKQKLAQKQKRAEYLWFMLLILSW